MPEMTEVEQLQARNAYLSERLGAIAAVLAKGPGEQSERVGWAIAEAMQAVNLNGLGLQGFGMCTLVFPDDVIAGQFLDWLSNSGEQDFMEAAEARDEPHSFVWNYNHRERRVLVTHSGDEED